MKNGIRLASCLPLKKEVQLDHYKMIFRADLNNILSVCLGNQLEYYLSLS